MVQEHPGQPAPEVRGINRKSVEVNDAAGLPVSQQCDHVISVHRSEHRQISRSELLQRFD